MSFQRNQTKLNLTGAALTLIMATALVDCAGPSLRVGISRAATDTADYALQRYRDEIVQTLKEMVRFKTVHQPGTPNESNPEFQALTRYLQQKADTLGLDFNDYGAVVVIGLGSGDSRLGLITHADVQPADASKWTKSPFELDLESEPDRLIGRGTEDDKGPIAIALYAMKSLLDRGIPIDRRVELIISYTEESDWAPMTAFLETWTPPQLNIALDSRYPVVTAEKGWCLVQLSLPLDLPVSDGDAPWLQSFTGGSFVSQVPGEARAVLAGNRPELQTRLAELVENLSGVEASFAATDSQLEVKLLGKAAHSSEPEEGVNAITHLSALLGELGVRGGAPARFVDFINRYVGTGNYGEAFGEIAFSHPFMGRLTVALTTLHEQDGRLTLSLNLRRPAGKTTEQLDREIRKVIADWKSERGLDELQETLYLGEPHLIEGAPHVPVLLKVFSHYTGDPDATALSAGGGTHARLFPNGVSFGPHMPGRAYSGHTEHEYLSREELDLDIKMITAMLVELAGAGSPAEE